MKPTHIIAPDERVVDLPPVREQRADEARGATERQPEPAGEAGGAESVKGGVVHLDRGAFGARQSGIVE